MAADDGVVDLDDHADTARGGSVQIHTYYAPLGPRMVVTVITGGLVAGLTM